MSPKGVFHRQSVYIGVYEYGSGALGDIPILKVTLSFIVVWIPDLLVLLGTTIIMFKTRVPHFFNGLLELAANPHRQPKDK